jgi:HD-GYP domain-containing protein (c-di-GMP phosphodiesterase class II)
VRDFKKELLFISPGLTPADHATNIFIQNRWKITTIQSVEKLTTNFQGVFPDVVLFDASPQPTYIQKNIEILHQLLSSSCLIVLTDQTNKSLIINCFRSGAHEVLEASASPEIVFERAMDLLKARDRAVEHLQLLPSLGQSDNQVINQLTINLEKAYQDVVERLSRAAHWRDDETGDHIRRIGAFSAEVGRQLGLSHQDIDLLKIAAPLHDIGKIGVPDSILLKPANLTKAEFELMKRHTIIGAEILSGSKDPLLKAAEEIALNHHEWWNGEGYPNKKKGEDIPLFARIVAVVDVYDALTHKRKYKGAIPMDHSIERMRRLRGTHFDPKVFDTFLESIETLTKLEGKLEKTLDPSTQTLYSIDFGIHSIQRFLETRER